MYFSFYCVHDYVCHVLCLMYLCMPEHNDLTILSQKLLILSLNCFLHGKVRGVLEQMNLYWVWSIVFEIPDDFLKNNKILNTTYHFCVINLSLFFL